MCKYFKPYEILPPRIYNEYGDKGLRWINPKLLSVMDFLREELGVAIIINNWKKGGSYKYRGLRVKESDVWKELSDHSFGNACDFNANGLSANEIREKILNEYAEELKLLGLSAIEDETYAPTWVHVSVADFSEWKDVKEINGIKILRDMTKEKNNDPSVNNNTPETNSIKPDTGDTKK